jgi:hypothetical protein
MAVQSCEFANSKIIEPPSLEPTRLKNGRFVQAAVVETIVFPGFFFDMRRVGHGDTRPVRWLQCVPTSRTKARCFAIKGRPTSLGSRGHPSGDCLNVLDIGEPHRDRNAGRALDVA